MTDLPLAAGHGDVDETAGVSEPLLGATLGGLLLLLGLNLFPLRQRSVRVCVLVPARRVTVVGRGVKFESWWEAWVAECERAYLGYKVLVFAIHGLERAYTYESET